MKISISIEDLDREMTGLCSVTKLTFMLYFRLCLLLLSIQPEGLGKSDMILHHLRNNNAPNVFNKRAVILKSCHSAGIR